MPATRRLTRSSKKEAAVSSDESSSVVKATESVPVQPHIRSNKTSEYITTHQIENTGEAARDVVEPSSSKPAASRKKRSSEPDSDSDSSQKKKKKTKNKRRSTIGRGRRSIVFADGKSLLTPDPKDEHCRGPKVAEKELAVAEKSVQQDENLEKLQGRALDTLDTITDKIEEQEQLLDVVNHLSNRLPNKRNIYMSHAVTEYTNYIDILKQESEKWDDLLDTHKELTQQAAEKVRGMKGLVITERPKTLTQDQKWMLDSKPDYVKMMQQLKLNREKLSLQILQVNRVVNLLSKLQGTVNEKIVESFREYYDTAFKDIRSTDSRQLIMSLCNSATSSTSSSSAN